MGYWDNQGATPTKVTWANPQFVPENQRSTGGWYYNPSSGYVERWWNSGTGPQSGGGSSGGGGGSSSNDNRQALYEQQKRDQEEALRKQEEARLAKEAAFKKEEEGLISQFQTASAGQEDLTKAYTRLAGEQDIAGITGQLNTLRTEVGKVKSLLDTLEGDINERTKGKLVSESQRRRMLAAEEAPLREQLGRLATGQQVGSEMLSTAYEQVGQGLSVLTAQQQKELQPLMMKMSAFSDRAAREYSGFQKAQENQLTLLLNQIQRGQQIADADWQMASQLALAEKEYERNKELIAYKTDEEIRKSAATKTGTSSLGSMSYEDFKNWFTGQGGSTGTGGTDSKLDEIFGVSAIV